MSNPASPNGALFKEKQVLMQDLNKRLECYIIRNREKDASAGSLERALQKMADDHRAELAQLKAAHEAALEALRKSKDAKMTENVELKENNMRQASVLEQLKASLLKQQQHANGQDLRVEQLSRELQTANTNLFKLSEAAARSRHDIGLLTADKEALQGEVAAERVRADRAVQQLGEKESLYLNIREDYDVLKKTTQQQLAEKDAELHELRNGRASVEQALRKEFGAQLQQLLQERQEIYQEEKDAALSELKNTYIALLASVRKDMEQAQRDATEARRRAEQKMRELEETSKVNPALEQQVRELTQQLAIQQRSATTHIEELHSTISDLRQQKQTLHDEQVRSAEAYEDLMDVKIALDMEIKAYRMMLEHEEQRLEGPESARKRYRGVGPQRQLQPELAASGDAGQTEPQDTQPGKGTADLEEDITFVISRLDSSYVCVKNESDGPLTLDGWSLRMRSSGASYRFPDLEDVAKDQEVTVNILENEPDERKEGWLYWIPKNGDWNQEGDVLELVNPDGTVIAYTEVDPEAEGDEEMAT